MIAYHIYPIAEEARHALMMVTAENGQLCCPCCCRAEITLDDDGALIVRHYSLDTKVLTVFPKNILTNKN